RRAHILRRHQQARTAPRRPKIHQQRNIIELDVLLKGTAGQFNRMGAEQSRMAAAALGFVIEPPCRYAVHRTTVRADDVQGLVHASAMADLVATTRLGVFSILRATSMSLSAKRRARDHAGGTPPRQPVTLPTGG